MSTATMWVIYPDEFGDEIQTVFEGFQKLELEF
jgi:hypothetical protein